MSSAIPKFTASGKNGTLLHSVQRSPCLNSPASISQFSLRKPQNDAFGISRLSLKSSSRMVNDRAVRMALVDERRLARSTRVTEPSGVLAYELVQGSLVEWSSSMDKSVGDPPTAVLLHGILGSRKNWGTFAKRLAQEFPMWQFLLVDLRCHGDSASVSRRGPHSVASTALDVLKLVAHLRITPRVLIGHSFGGKVVLSMVDQAAKPLARPIRVWVLDATPGKVRAGGDGEDHPSELISFLRRLSTEVCQRIHKCFSHFPASLEPLLFLSTNSILIHLGFSLLSNMKLNPSKDNITL
ncbi:Abhydrolase domain-containing protein C22H12.03 [Linum perenne]